jgi:hypothetical protein
MQREFVYTADKNLSSSQLNASNVTMGSVQEKTFGRPFTELSNSTVKNYEAGPETSGTYRARTNNAYDNSDNSVAARPGAGTNPYGDYRNFKVDYDEYWKTNI